MNFKSKFIPYYLTIFAIFIPIIVHLIQFKIETYFHIVTFIITLSFLRKETRYPRYFFYFITIWLLILLLHAVFKNNIVVFGYMQSFFYGICFYAIFKNITNRIEGRELLNQMYKIYGVLFITLIAELIINMMGLESLLLDLFSGNNVGKSYQVLPSRIIGQIFGYDFSSLNSIFFGPQSGSILIFLCLLFFNPFDKLLKVKNRIKFLICLGLFIIGNTMTVNLIFMIFLGHFIFFSKHSSLNRPSFKLSLVLILFFSSSILFKIFFYALQSDLYLDWYFFLWNQPVRDMFALGTKELLFGIPANMSIENYTSTWEFGLVQTIFMSGIMPVIFLLGLGIYLLVKLAKYRHSFLVKISSTYRDYYQSSRLSVFVFSVCLFSLIHYASIFSTGFFQLMGFHIAVGFYCFDKMEYFIKAYKATLISDRHESITILE